MYIGKDGPHRPAQLGHRHRRQSRPFVGIPEIAIGLAGAEFGVPGDTGRDMGGHWKWDMGYIWTHKDTYAYIWIHKRAHESGPGSKLAAGPNGPGCRDPIASFGPGHGSWAPYVSMCIHIYAYVSTCIHMCSHVSISIYIYVYP